MKVGNNIKLLREKAGLTQKQLAESLFVSPQAISRYENDEVEPNLDILEKMCSIFDCKIEDLIYGQKVKETKKEEAVEKNDDNVAIVINTDKKEIEESASMFCHDCHKKIEENETTHTVTRRDNGVSSEVIICDGCYNKGLELDQKIQESPYAKKIRSKNSKRMFQNVDGRKSLIGGIISGVAIFLLTLILGLVLGKALKPGVWVGLSFLFAYLVLSVVYCIFSDTYISDMFVDIASTSVKVPVYFVGHLFGDELVVLIPLKIVGGIISAGIGVLLFGFALALSMLCASVSFPFYIIGRLKLGD